MPYLLIKMPYLFIKMAYLLINSNALLIKTNSSGKGVFKATTIEYTLNGTPNVITFTDEKQHLIGVQLSAGYNIAEIVNSDYRAILYFNSHENFELVL